MSQVLMKCTICNDEFAIKIHNCESTLLGDKGCDGILKPSPPKNLNNNLEIIDLVIKGLQQNIIKGDTKAKMIAALTELKGKMVNDK